MISAAVFTQLTTNTAVEAIIAQRLYPDYDKQADLTYPLCVYKFDKAGSQMASDGPTGLKQTNVTVACIANTKAQADTLADAVEDCLDGASWTAQDGTRIQGSFLVDDGRDDDIVTETSTEAILYYVTSLEFLVWFAK